MSKSRAYKQFLQDKKDKVIREKVCSICLEKQSYIGSITTKCKHTFHTECITKWTDRNDNCPLCRTDKPLLKLPQMRSRVLSIIPIDIGINIRSIERRLEQLRMRDRRNRRNRNLLVTSISLMPDEIRNSIDFFFNVIGDDIDGTNEFHFINNMIISNIGVFCNIDNQLERQCATSNMLITISRRIRLILSRRLDV